jgi:hypothetical protein
LFFEKNGFLRTNRIPPKSRENPSGAGGIFQKNSNKIKDIRISKVEHPYAGIVVT